MPEARYLIRLAPSSPAQPSDQPLLLTQLRRLAEPLGGRLLNLRITPIALEFDLFCSQDEELDSFFQVWSSVGHKKTVKRLDRPPRQASATEVTEEARALFNEYRFWEVHEVLEDLWRETSWPEKEWLQGLILLAAAWVHVQKNEQSVVWRMLEEALDRLKSAPANYYGWNMGALRAHFEAALHRREMSIYHA